MIESLSYSTLKEAIALVNEVFPHQGLTEKASYAFPLSLRSNWVAQRILRLVNIVEVNYWVAVEDHKVLGVTGLYSYTKDVHEAYWLGWTCVAPSARGQGLGGKLVDFAIARAGQSGRSFLRLYTSTHPNEATAQSLYEKRGLKIIAEQPLEGNLFKKIYRELNLRA